MAPKIKNAIIFIVIGAIFVLIYVFYIKKAPDTATLISSPSTSLAESTDTTAENSSVAQEFLTLLLSVESIKLNDAIFSDNAFASLHDSSITLTPDGNEGRSNPFAPLGTDSPVPPAIPPIPPTGPITPTPPKTTPPKTTPPAPITTP